MVETRTYNDGGRIRTKTIQIMGYQGHYSNWREHIDGIPFDDEKPEEAPPRRKVGYS
jgi:hypothetical protein